MFKTYIVDGNSLLFRSYFSTAYTGNLMMSKDGIPTNAIFAFHNLMKKIKAQLEDGDHLFVAFDTDKPTFRKKDFENYKAQRSKTPDELVAQLPIAREMLDNMNINWRELEGYEADDLCGSMAKYALSKADQVRIFTSDKDFLQLLDFSDNITVEMLKKGLTETVCYNKKNLKELFGINPNQVADFKGIAGDPSDNYSGISGIGEKTAIKLLNEHGHLEQILDYCKANPTSATNKKIIDGEKDAIFFKQLAKIYTDLDMEKEYEKSIYKPYSKTRLLSFYNKYQFVSFAKSIDKLADVIDDSDLSKPLAGVNKIEKEVIKKDKIEINSINEIKEDIIFFTFDSTESNENKAFLNGFVLASKTNIYYISLENAKKDPYFTKFLSDDKKQINVFDYKGLYVLLSRNNFENLKGDIFDILLALYLLDSDSTADKNLAFVKFSATIDKKENIAMQVAYNSIMFVDEIKKQLIENKSYDLLKDVEQPLSEILAQMQLEGFPINKDTLEKIDQQLSNKAYEIYLEIASYIGKEANVNSTKQLEHVLFDILKIKRNKGEKGTSIDVLNAHYFDHPVIPLIIQYRQYSKLISTYTSGLPSHIFPDGKFHSLFNQCLTSTGRLSMSEPNLQNISIRSEEGKNIRKAFFYPENDIYILSLDYSQIELRMLAHVANIKPLKDIFFSNEDIHSATAAQVFNVPISEVTSDMRRKAKAVNFGIVYGISAYGLANQINIRPKEAADLIREFEKTFVGLTEFQQKCIEDARNYGFVTTILNRRRYLNDINSQNHALKAFSERAAVNSVIQGSAADLIKVAMKRCNDVLKDYKAKMILQIHDELLFKIPKDEIDILLPKLKNAMEGAIKLSVPLKVDGTYARSWYDAH